MKCFVICLLILCFGHLNLNGQPYNIALEKSNNNCLNQTGSVLRENNSKNHFEKIRVIHKMKDVNVIYNRLKLGKPENIL